MKEGGDVLVIPRQPVVAVSPTYLSTPVGVGVGVHTPSPFSFSVASTTRSRSRSRWSTSIHIHNLFLRAMLMVFSFASSLALAAAAIPPPADNNHQKHSPSNSSKSFVHYPEFVYNFVITTMTFIYSAYQLFKGICDIAFRGVLISDKASDYTSFILDQLASYLLVSCLSVTVHQHLERNTSLVKATIVSVWMSAVALLISAICAILSGYKLSKRVIW